jgi:hypothetical protein
VIGNLNGRAGTEKDCIASDILNKLLLDAIEFIQRITSLLKFLHVMGRDMKRC